MQALQPQDALLAALRGALGRCDEDYVALLELQERELGALLEAMQRSSSDILSHQTRAAAATVEAFLQARLTIIIILAAAAASVTLCLSQLLQEHAELRQSYQATVAALMGERSALETKCVSQYLDACAEFQAELQGLGEALAEEHSKLRRRSVDPGHLLRAGETARSPHVSIRPRRRHFSEVAGLDAKMDAERASNILGADKLSYEHRVLGEGSRLACVQPHDASTRS